jgi:hypothetical protein
MYYSTLYLLLNNNFFKSDLSIIVIIDGNN